MDLWLDTWKSVDEEDEYQARHSPCLHTTWESYVLQSLLEVLSSCRHQNFSLSSFNCEPHDAQSQGLQHCLAAHAALAHRVLQHGTSP